ncbi:FAD-dependent tricarballylate dehydrogenase TcuA [Microbulbifer sp. MKSA007]|nr:FAD-dependent tricarballylate dehydrogenase TcuA [Microbulbifer sp. MKSA007]
MQKGFLSVNTHYDLAVIGGGNAALCAAITAAELGAKVIILETAPKPYRGGNSRHTRDIRCMHRGPLGPLEGDYSEDEYYEDLLKVTGGKTNEQLARLVIRSSEKALPWMQKHGVHFQPPLSGTLSLTRTNAFFLGGGKSLVNAYYRTAGKLGVDVLYRAHVKHLQLEGNHITRVDYVYEGQQYQIEPRSVVAASGGFEANLKWLEKAWGPAAENFLIRGTPYNRGVVLEDLLEQGVQSVGDPTQCHAVAIDGRAPKFDGGIVTRLDCVPFSIVVNKEAQRFYDEGEDIWPKRYAIWGRLVAQQPDQVAFAIIDSKSLKMFMPSAFPPTEANTLEELAEKTSLPSEKLIDTIATFNAACGSSDAFHPTELDSVATTGLTPEKTNWARPISEPPFYCYSLRTGVTFTYLALKIDENAQCSTATGPVKNLWAAGETMAGSILSQGYLAGLGMMIGTVFGRIAGREAANYANG